MSTSRNGKLRAVSSSDDEQKDGSRERREKQVQQAIEEARMVLPGIQALFGFQLIAVFNNAFTRLSEPLQLLHYFAALLVSISIALIMTPAAYHRQVERQGASSFFVRLASRLIASAMIPLMAALCIEVYLLGALILESPSSSAMVAVGLFAVFSGLWFVYPWFARRQALKDVQQRER